MRIEKGRFVKKLLIMVLGGAVIIGAGRYLYDHHIAQPQHPSLFQVAHSLTGQDLVFASNRTGTYNIWSRSLATGKLTDLTKSNADNMNPQVSPNGRYLVFYSNRDDQTAQIFLLDRKHPSKVQQLTYGLSPSYDPVFTTNGKQILFKRADQDGNFGQIWSMNTNGSHQVNLTPSLDDTYEAYKPEPLNATLAAITVRTRQGDPNSDELYLLNMVTRQLKRLTFNNVPNWFPAVNPADPKTVAFISKTYSDDPYDSIYTMNIDGGNRKLVSQKNTETDFDDPSWTPSWTPGGPVIVCISDRLDHQSFGRYAVFLMGLNGEAILLDQSPVGQDLSPILVPANP